MSELQPLGAGVSFNLEDVTDYEERLKHFEVKVLALPFQTFAPELEDYPGAQLVVKKLNDVKSYGIVNQYDSNTDRTHVKFLAFREPTYMSWCKGE